MAHYLSDHPTFADALGRMDLLEQVGKHVQQCDPPHVIGIYGDWGSGKTSFLRSLQLYLSGVSDVIDVKDLSKSEETEKAGVVKVLNLDGARLGYPVIWFDAWRYQGEQAPVVALLHEIRRQFSPGAKLARFVAENGEKAFRSALLAFDQLAKEIAVVAPPVAFVAKAAGNAQAVGEEYERRNLSTPLTTEVIREQLDHAIGKMVGALSKPKMAVWKFAGVSKAASSTNKDRLTIIIDDLDRCEPAVALRLLEGIKVYLSLSNCVFVLGVNPERLREHIAEGYRKDAKDGGTSMDVCRHRAKDYLDKIVNVHYDFGIDADFYELFKASLGDKFTVNGIDMRDAVLECVRTTRCLPPNPRRIKALVSTLQRYAESKKPPENPDASLLVAMAYMNQFHHEIVRKMKYYDGYVRTFLRWCAKPDPSKESFISEDSPVRLDHDSGVVSFEGLLPDPNCAEVFEAPVLFYPDPISGNVLHVQRLFIDWLKKPEGRDGNLEPYILLG